MNKHQKLALVVAPFLLILGYVAADYYSEYTQSNEERIYELNLEDECKLASGACLLQWEQFKLEIFNQQGQTQLTSNHPLSSAVLARVFGDSKESPIQMTSDVERTTWSTASAITQSEADDKPLMLRLIVSIDNTYFFKEFNASVHQ